MSRDDTIGVFKFKYNGKNVYGVIHTQCIEDLDYWEWFIKHITKFTYNKKKAFNIAKCISKINPDCEYGIQYFDSHEHTEYIGSLPWIASPPKGGWLG